MRALQPTTVSLICCFLAFNFFSRISEAGKHPKELFCERKVIQHMLPICIHILRYREKYFKRRTVYSASHPASYNPSVITNQEAHMIYMEIWKGLETLDLQGQMKRAKQRKKPKQFPTIFLLRRLVVVVSKYNIFHFSS